MADKGHTDADQAALDSEARAKPDPDDVTFLHLPDPEPEPEAKPEPEPEPDDVTRLHVPDAAAPPEPDPDDVTFLRLPGPDEPAPEPEPEPAPEQDAPEGPADRQVDEDEVTPPRLREPETDSARPPPPPPPQRRATLKQGDLVGRYVILGTLGAGGLGDVYRAYDPDLDRNVAVKLLLPAVAAAADDGDSASPTVRLMREAQAMAQVSHPNVVAVYDVGALGAEVFITMELVEGQTLDAWLDKERRSWREIQEVMLGAGGGLIAAHASGLVHRDFKPGNVIVGDDGRVRVLDFGLARAQQARDLPFIATEPTSDSDKDTSLSRLLDKDLTSAGDLVGTPSYMAPEQFRSAKVDARVDQYAFAVTLFEALHGKKPFRGSDFPDLFDAIINGRVTEPPPGRTVPRWLDRVMRRAMSKNRDDRYPAMRELLHALLHDRRARRRRLVIAGSLVALLGVGTVAGSWLYRPAMTQQERSVVDTLELQARDAASKSHYVYPPPDQPAHPTAFTKVLELEGLDGAAREPAKVRSAALRQEFAGTLTKLGDRFWDQPGGRPFASDYYAAALVFEPENRRARERNTWTPGELATFRGRAKKGDFSGSELVAAESLGALAQPEGKDRVERLAAVLERADGPSPTTQARIEGLLGAKERKAVRTARREATSRKRRSEAPPPPRSQPQPEATTPPPLPPAPPPPIPEPEATPPPVAAPAPPKPPASARPEGELDPVQFREDKKEAAALTKKGIAELDAGRLSQAEALLHRALAADRRHAKALAGLSELYFERGAYEKAIKFGRRAVARTPNNAGYRILLGDAYFRVLGYDNARKQYEKADALGHAGAAGRLKRLDGVLGG